MTVPDPNRPTAGVGEEGFTHPMVIECAEGPLLLRGDHLVMGPDGELHPTTRPVSAVCRCERSSRQPWCDGTHKFIPVAPTLKDQVGSQKG